MRIRKQIREDSPILSYVELKEEIKNRTRISEPLVDRVLNSFAEIILECLIVGVEVRFPSLGVFSWTIKEPEYNKVYMNMHTKEKMPPKDYPGYKKPLFIPTNSFKQGLKENTLFFPEGEKKD